MNNLWDFKDHVIEVGILLDLTIECCGDALGAGYKVSFNPWAKWAECVKALGTGPLSIFLLKFATCHIVGHRVSKDHIIDFFLWNIFADAPDNNC